MTPKAYVDRLVRLIRKRAPKCSISVDAPVRPDGGWYIDAKVSGRCFVVEYRPGLGFGLSSGPSEGFGEGPDEIFEHERATVDRILELVRTNGKTDPHRVRHVQQLRTRKHVSQVALAAKLKVRQPTVSKLEKRNDMTLSTLRRYVEALGGELLITARFPEGSVEIGETARRRSGRR